MKVKEQQLCSRSRGPGVLRSQRVVRDSGGQRGDGSAKERGIYRVHCNPEILKKFGISGMLGDSKKNCNLKLQV